MKLYSTLLVPLVLITISATAIAHDLDVKTSSSRSYATLLRGIPDACTRISISTKGDDSIDQTKFMIALRAKLKSDIDLLIQPYLESLGIPISECKRSTDAEPTKARSQANVFLLIRISGSYKKPALANININLDVLDLVKSQRNGDTARIPASTTKSTQNYVPLEKLEEKTKESVEELMKWTLMEFLKANG